MQQQPGSELLHRLTATEPQRVARAELAAAPRLGVFAQRVEPVPLSHVQAR